VLLFESITSCAFVLANY